MDDLDRLEAELFKNPKIKAEYDALEPEYALIERLVAAREADAAKTKPCKYQSPRR